MALPLCYINLLASPQFVTWLSVLIPRIIPTFDIVRGI